MRGWLKIPVQEFGELMADQLTLVFKNDEGEVEEELELFKRRGSYVLLPRAAWPITCNPFESLERIRKRSSVGKAMSSMPAVQLGGSTAWEEQPKAARVTEFLVKESLGGILCAPCGKGKTLIGIEVARRLGLSTCVLVHKRFLMEQWAERIAEHLPSATVGFWQRDRMDNGYKCDFVIAMVQSLVSDYRSYPKVQFESFGTVITDEVHRFAAPIWQKAITRFSARYRLGLTATLERRDSKELVFLKHIGPVVYTMESQPRKPLVRRVFLDTEMEVPELWTGDVNTSKMVTMLGENDRRSEIIAEYAVRAARSGRKVLVLSERRVQVQFLLEVIETALDEDDDLVVDKYVGKMSQKRLDEAAEADVIVGTYHMAQEGLDIPRLDTLLMATPKTGIVQAVGRILRDSPDKQQPVVVDFVDRAIDICLDYWHARKRRYIEQGYL